MQHYTAENFISMSFQMQRVLALLKVKIYDVSFFSPDTAVYFYENSSENSVRKCFMSNEICTAVDSRKRITFVIPGRRWERTAGKTRYVINRNSNNNNCHTHTRTYSCLPRPLWVLPQPFKCGFTLIILGVKCKRQPQQKVCILQQACQVCLSHCRRVRLSLTVCQSVFVWRCLRVSFCCRATSLFVLCVLRLLRHFKAPLTTLRMCNFHNFHWQILVHSHSHTNTLIHTQRGRHYAGHGNERKLKR